jgi:Xaa-Pro aminopeptidase
MERIKKLIDKLNSLSIDSMLITNVTNVSYISGFTGDSSHLIISSNGCILLTDGRYTEQARNECIEGLEVFNWIENNRYGVQTYQYCIDKLHITSLAFESRSLSHHDYSRLSGGLKIDQFIPVQDLIEKIRQIKDKNEIANLTEACSISDSALNAILPIIKPGITEIDITAELEYKLKTLGADDLSFNSLILSGKRTSLLHGKPGKNKLQSGDFLLFDFGALKNGYHADISRTFVIGKASAQQKEVFEIIRKAQSAAVEVLQEGINGNLPDTVVRNHIPEKYIRYYYPGLGHGVGLDIHELPFIKSDADFTFHEGMVVTIEPGIYIPDWGGLRIEDTVVINKKDYQILTQFPRELLEL